MSRKRSNRRAHRRTPTPLGLSLETIQREALALLNFGPGPLMFDGLVMLSDILEPTGHSEHLLTVGDMCTYITVEKDNDHDGDGSSDDPVRIDVEHPEVVGELLRVFFSGDDGSMVLRSFTGKACGTGEHGSPVPVKQLRGWYISDSDIHPLTAAQMFDAACTDHSTGSPIPPEPGVECVDAHSLPTFDDEEDDTVGW